MRFLPLILSTLFVAALPAAQDADLLVVEKKNNSVGFYASSGARVGEVRVGETPHEVALSRDGRYAYVSDNGVLWMDYDGPGGNTLSIIDLPARRRVGILPMGKFHRPHGIGLDPGSGRAFVTAENPDRLVLVDLDARAVIQDFDNGGIDPHMVTFAADGWGYVSNTSSGTVGAVHASSGELHLIEVGKGPQGSLLSRDGSKLWVTCRDEGRIDVIDTASKSLIGSIATGPGANRVVSHRGRCAAGVLAAERRGGRDCRPGRAAGTGADSPRRAAAFHLAFQGWPARIRRRTGQGSDLDRVGA